MEQYTFTVPTKGLCIMCLADDTKTSAEELSIQSLHTYVNLNFRKIFNITNLNIFQKDGCMDDSAAAVDINVTLCRSCKDLRNKFCDLHDEMETIQKRLNSCLQSMLEVMINAESNVIRSRHYQQKITGLQGKASADLIKKSIPDMFRKEAMQKCVYHVEKARLKNKALSKKKSAVEESILTIHEELGFVPEAEENPNGGDFQENTDSSDNGMEENMSDEDETMRVDEDADPEELMMKYNSDPESYKHSIKEQNVSKLEQCFDESSWENGEVEQGLDSKGTTFNSKYQCKICNKVVVSLKNLELHQRRHTGEKPFACPFCEQHFRDTSNLRSHALRYHRQFLFANFKDATLTEEQFKVALDKIVQSIVQINEGLGLSHQSHRCFICKKDYTQKYAIEDHIVQRHYDVLSTAVLHLQKDVLSYESGDIAQYMVQIQEGGETCTVCGHCGQQFQTGQELNSHMKVHVKVKVARNHGAVQKSNTSDSMIPLKMKCTFCSKYFEDLHALTKHKTLHQGNCATAASRESIYNCEHCGRSFCSYYSQRSHVLSFHRYQVFHKYLPPNTTAAEIETVIKGITGKYTKLPNGLFQCSLCKKEITQLRKLQSHVLVTHFDEVVIKLKVAIHKLGVKNGGLGGSSELELPDLDRYEEDGGEGLNFFSGIPYDDGELGDYQYEDDEDGSFLTFHGDKDASESLEVLISHPD